MRTLLVEDDLSTAHSIATQVEAAGYICDVVGTTAEAHELLRRATYRVAILDHYLQGETSLFLASHLRLRHPRTKIITITGSALFANGYGIDRLSCDFLFRKPFQVSDLVEIVKYLDATSDWTDKPANRNTSAIAM
ncbi:MAG: response regulator [Silicimonas sp.]|nr:response regulator [Silicimonas sp.]